MTPFDSAPRAAAGAPLVPLLLLLLGWVAARMLWGGADAPPVAISPAQPRPESAGSAMPTAAAARAVPSVSATSRSQAPGWPRPAVPRPAPVTSAAWPLDAGQGHAFALSLPLPPVAIPLPAFAAAPPGRVSDPPGRVAQPPAYASEPVALYGPPNTDADARGAVARRLPRPVAASVEQQRAEAMPGLIFNARYGAVSLASPPGAGPLLALSPDQPPDPPEPSRFTGGGWLFARGGSSAAGLAPAPRYGGSQAGARLAWRMSDGVPGQVSVFVRASASPARSAVPGDSEGAAGIAVTPRAALPVTLAFERRVFRRGGGANAAYAVLAPPAQRLSGDVRLAAYAAAGVVMARRQAGFHDAALRLTRPIADSGAASVQLGAGVWTGGQPGGHRVDIGPSVTVPLSVDHRPMRVQIDWRQRVAGNAAPASGPALTLAADF